MEFQKIQPHQLPQVSVTLQALDNEWVPGSILDKMLRNPRSALGDVKKERNHFVRTEFFRSIVNAEAAVAAHNSYLNDAVVGAFLDPKHEEHGAFRALLADGVLVPFLFTAASPEISPGDVGFTHDAVQRENWNRLCREVDGLQCLRLDWDDRLNRQKIRQRLSGQFHSRLQSLAAGDGENFAEALRPKSGDTRPQPAEAGPQLIRRLQEVNVACANHLLETGEHITRDQIYRKFIVVEGSQPEEGRFDPVRPFVKELKQMVDLIYTTNLADALGRYPLTPVDSPARAVLQELTSADRTQSINGDELLQLVKSLEFDLIQSDLFLSSYGLLKLDDVIALRSDSEAQVWRPYIDSVRKVLLTPELGDPKDIADIYGKYTELARHAGNLASRRRKTTLRAKWEPRVKLVLEVSGAVVLQVFWPQKGEIVHTIADVVLDRLAEKAAPAVAKLVIAGHDHLFGDSITDEVAASTVFWQGRMTNAGEQLKELGRKLAEDPQFHDLKREVPAATTATVDEQG